MLAMEGTMERWNGGMVDGRGIVVLVEIREGWNQIAIIIIYNLFLKCITLFIDSLSL
jgi:hypothetical protein